MITKNMQVKIPSGFTPDKIAMFIQIASQFESRIHVEMQNKKVNAKSLMGMMSLTLPAGECVDIIADGDDEAAALERIEEFLSNK